MVKLAANLSMMFNEFEFLDRFTKASEFGFKGVEYLFPYDYDRDHLVNLLGENELVQVLHNLPAGDWDSGERGIACHPDRAGEFQESVGIAVDYASTLGCAQVNCLAGILPEGVDEIEAHGTFVDNLKYAAPICKNKGIKLIVESINTIDMPGFFLNNTEQAKGILSDVGSKNLFLQYDIYHMQIMEGDLARTIQSNLEVISHMQLADNPGRHEPGTGEINYDFLFQFIDEIGYPGWIGCEYIPTTTTLGGLSWIEPYIGS